MSFRIRRRTRRGEEDISSSPWEEGCELSLRGLLSASYLCIIVGVLTGIMPAITLIGLGTIGFGWKAAKGALKYYNDTEAVGSGIGSQCA